MIVMGVQRRAIFFLCILLCIPLLCGAEPDVLGSGRLSHVQLSGTRIECSDNKIEIERANDLETQFRARVDFDKLLNAGDTVSLFERIQKIAQNEPNNFFARVELALFENNEYPLPVDSKIAAGPVDNSANANYAAIYKLSPNYYKTLYLIARYAHTPTIQSELSFYFNCVDSMRPNFEPLPFAWADAYARAGDPESALRKLLSANTSSPNHQLDRVESAKIIARAAHLDERLTLDKRRNIQQKVSEIVSEGLDKNPGNRRFIYFKASTLAYALATDASRMDEVQQLVRQLREFDQVTFRPASIDLQLSLARKDWPGCVRYAREVSRKIGGGDMRNVEAWCEVQQRHWKEAFDLEKAFFPKRVGTARVGAPDANEIGTLMSLSRNEKFTERVYALLRTVDEKQVPIAKIWECRAVASHYTPFHRPVGKEFTAFISGCRDQFRRLQMEGSQAETRFLKDASSCFSNDANEVEKLKVDKELGRRDPSTLPLLYVLERVDVLIENEHNPTAALAFIKSLGEGFPRHQLAVAEYHLLQKDRPAIRQILGKIRDSDFKPEDWHAVRITKFELFKELGQFEKAMAELEEDHRQNQSEHSLYRLADYVNEKKGPKAALAYIESHHSSDSDPSFMLWTLWAHLLDKTGQHKASLEKLEQAAKYGPNDPLTLINLATTWAQDFKDCAKAKPYILRAAKLSENKDQQSHIRGLLLKCGLHDVEIRPSKDM